MPLPIWVIEEARPYPHTDTANSKRVGEREREKERELDTSTHRLGHFLRELPANEITTIAATAASAAAAVGIFI